MGLSYNGVSYNSQTGTTTVDSNSYQPTTGTGNNNSSTFNSNDSSQPWYNSLISALPGIAMGAAAIIGATKNGQPIYSNTPGGYYPPQQTGMPGWIWIVLGLGVIGLLFFAFKPGKAK